MQGNGYGGWSSVTYNYTQTQYERPPYTRVPSRWVSNQPVSKSESKIRNGLFKEGREKLEARLGREEKSRKAMSDAASRGRRQPQKGAPPAHSRLQTYDDAMAARMAARRSA